MKSRYISPRSIWALFSATPKVNFTPLMVMVVVSNVMGAVAADRVAGRVAMGAGLVVGADAVSAVQPAGSAANISSADIDPHRHFVIDGRGGEFMCRIS